MDVTSVRRALGKLNVDHTIHVAHNGADALEALTGNDDIKIVPDIILLDMNMPKMNGLEFLGIIKSYYSLKNIRIYITTTSAEEYDRMAAKNLGITGYILKPLDFDSTRAHASSAAIASLKEDLLSA